MKFPVACYKQHAHARKAMTLSLNVRFTFYLFHWYHSYWESQAAFETTARHVPAYPPATTLTNARWRCRKWATTMCTYWSSCSRPLPMKHRCSPAAAALALSACSLLASSACTAVMNSARLISIWRQTSSLTDDSTWYDHKYKLANKCYSHIDMQTDDSHPFPTLTHSLPF